MVSDFGLSSIAAALVIVLRRSILLILYPYRTMRSISLRSNRHQVVVIFAISLCYFLAARGYKQTFIEGIAGFFVFLGIFYATVLFFYFISHASKTEVTLSSFIYTFSYTLMPTLIWFWTTFLLFVILPPPRTYSLLGAGFSILFVSYSLSLLAWKLILLYLAIRFSSRQGIYRIIYMLLLYLVIFIPASVFFYYHRIFRIPFL